MDKRRLSDLRVAYFVYYLALALYIAPIALRMQVPQPFGFLTLVFWILCFWRLDALRRAAGLRSLGEVEALAMGREHVPARKGAGFVRNLVSQAGVVGSVSCLVLLAVLVGLLV